MDFTFGMHINILPFWVCVTSHAQSTQNKFLYLCNISRKAWRMKLIFCLQIKVKGFFKVILSFQMCMSRHVQITQNNRFAICLQYLKKEVRNEADFLHADKHESLLQIDTMILMEMVKHSKQFPKQKVCNVFTISQKRSCF